MTADYAITIDKHGGPEVLTKTALRLAAPGRGEVRMRNTMIGLNFIDLYHRSGLYPTPLPATIGLEAAGVVEAIGPEVEGLAVGDRVCTFGPSLGAYATVRNIRAVELFHTPAAISDEVAATSLLKACTCEFLVERCARIAAGQTALVHAAAGGVGQFLVQWLKHAGAQVIGVVSTTEKAAQARQAGADHVLIAEANGITRAVKDLTNGRGAAVTFDGVGQATWSASLEATALRGLIVSFGNASGPVTQVALGALSSHGSLFVTRPTLFDYYANQAEREMGVRRVFDLLARGVLRPTIGSRYGLSQATQAHHDIASRKTSGSTLLVP